ncbi:MAG: hypothetical protein E7357_06050 [Clostridiales bacterium]|nr:hypothetical protein [Clostridiales bacterium]
MTGVKNVLEYITSEGKVASGITALEYLQKNTGVFNQNGMISQEEVEEMKRRAMANQGNIWHGFISFNKQDSAKIDTPEKCIQLVKQTFSTFLQESHFNPKNIDLMCALHLDRPHHLHIHFVFWEKEPKLKGKNGELQYRAKGKISERAIDNMFVRLGLFVDENKEETHIRRDEAIKQLRGMTAAKTAMNTTEAIKAEILSLAKDLPKTGRISYGSKDMESFRGRVDNIVKMLLDYDGKARAANVAFYKALEERRRAIANICGKEYGLTDKNIKPEKLDKDLPKYHHKIDDKNIKIIEEIEEDYRRRQGNLVLRLAKFIKPEYYERKKGKKYKTNDKKLKRSLVISARNVKKRFDGFFLSFGRDIRDLFERDFSHRLQEIEKEIERERAKQSGESQGTNKEGFVKD